MPPFPTPLSHHAPDPAADLAKLRATAGTKQAENELEESAKEVLSLVAKPGPELGTLWPQAIAAVHRLHELAGAQAAGAAEGKALSTFESLVFHGSLHPSLGAALVKLLHQKMTHGIQETPAFGNRALPVDAAADKARRASERLVALHPLEGQNVRLSISELAEKIGRRARLPHEWEKELARYLEDAVRTNGGYVEYGKEIGGEHRHRDAIRRDYPEPDRKAYQALADSCPTWNSESTWAGWYPKNPTDAKDAAGNTFKFYATPSAAPDQIPAFVAAFPDLVSRLEKFGGGRMVGLKIPPTFTMFIGLNDRLVVHFYDASLRQGVAETVKSWATDHGVRLAARSHEFGIDRESGDAPTVSDPNARHEASDSGSFTQRMARKFARAVAELAESGQYSDAQLAQWTVDIVRKNLRDPAF